MLFLTEQILDFSGNRHRSGCAFLQEMPASGVVQQPCWVLHAVRQEHAESMVQRWPDLQIDEEMSCNEAWNTYSSTARGAPQLLSELPSVCRKTGKEIVCDGLFTIKWVYVFAEWLIILESVHFLLANCIAIIYFCTCPFDQHVTCLNTNGVMCFTVVVSVNADLIQGNTAEEIKKEDIKDSAIIAVSSTALAIYLIFMLSLCVVLRRRRIQNG